MADRQAVSPASAEVVAHILRAEQRHPELVKVRRMGVTAEGRPIHAVTITDPSVAERDKQHVLIAAGHHGNEESGRLIALALIDWLTSLPALEVRQKQKIVVMPNMNPDSAERDVYATPDGPQPFRDHAPSGPKLPEGKALEEAAYELEPELYVDMHARGYAGCSYDMALWSEPATYTEDDYLLHRIAAEMAEAGERAGIPNLAHPLSWPGFMSESPDVSSACAFAYRRFKSLSILTETCESNQYAYPAKDRVRSGLAKLKALLAWGNRRHPKLRYAGYPCYLVGMFPKGLVAIGKTAAARRQSRVALWRNWKDFSAFEVEGPEKPDEKRLKVEYGGPALTHGAGFQVAVCGDRAIRSVRLNGRKLRSSENSGYYTWRQGCATHIVVALAHLDPGKYEIVIAHSGEGGTRSDRPCLLRAREAGLTSLRQSECGGPCVQEEQRPDGARQSPVQSLAAEGAAGVGGGRGVRMPYALPAAAPRQAVEMRRRLQPRYAASQPTCWPHGRHMARASGCP